jgi:Domain of unknown function (DUF1918)
MRAKPGDRLVIKSHRVGRSERVGEIVEVRGEHGEPPYLVRWSGDDHEAIVYPGSDALVEHKRRRASAG